jgi:hypothetical protein
MKKVFLILSIPTLMISCGDATDDATENATCDTDSKTTEVVSDVEQTEEVSE